MSLRSANRAFEMYSSTGCKRLQRQMLRARYLIADKHLKQSGDVLELKKQGLQILASDFG